MNIENQFKQRAKRGRITAFLLLIFIIIYGLWAFNAAWFSKENKTEKTDFTLYKPPITYYYDGVPYNRKLSEKELHAIEVNKFFSHIDKLNNEIDSLQKVINNNP